MLGKIVLLSIHFMRLCPCFHENHSEDVFCIDEKNPPQKFVDKTPTWQILPVTLYVNQELL